jgi:dTMP kinase
VSRRGRFITLEGGEGAGKSTQAVRLAEWLRGQGLSVLVTREPGGSSRAEILRELLLGGCVAPFGPEAEALVFAIARADHVMETIRPALEVGTWVVSDRFMDSTRAYQGAAGVPPDALDRLDEIAVGETRPDLTLILDVAPTLGLRRMRGRDRPVDRFEADEMQVHEARRRAFLDIASREPERCVVIDGAGDEADIAAAIRAAVAERLGPPAEGSA